MDFANPGGIVCQYCGVPMTMNSWSKHTPDRCAYWKEKRRVEGDEVAEEEEPTVMGYSDEIQDGFDVLEGGADDECEEDASRSGLDEESEQGSATSDNGEERAGEEDKMSGEGGDSEH